MPIALEVLDAGIQTTLQGKPRSGYRAAGVPSAGAADRLSLALANRLVGNGFDETALEITYTGFRCFFERETSIAITGAGTRVVLDGADRDPHRTLHVRAGQILDLQPDGPGCRCYLAIAGGFEGAVFLGSPSTYLPAGFGGLDGRALKAGDLLRFKNNNGSNVPEVTTPRDLRPVLSYLWVLHALRGPEYSDASSAIFAFERKVTRRTSRMGIQLGGTQISLSLQTDMKSAPVFPGTVQCPQDGMPFILLADAQTTGGYPRVAQIALSEHHRLGQLKPDDRVILLETSPARAMERLALKQAAIRKWIPDFSFV